MLGIISPTIEDTTPKGMKPTLRGGAGLRKRLAQPAHDGRPDPAQCRLVLLRHLRMLSSSGV